MDYKNYKYKKYSFNELVKIIDSNKSFFEKYINDYLGKTIHTNSIKEFIEKNKKFIAFYKSYDSNARIHFHILVDKSNKRIMAIEKTLFISDKFFNIKFFKEIKNEYDIPDNIQILYVMNLYIDPEYRGRKLCNYLKDRVNKNAIKNNVSYLIAEVHKDNIISIKCNEKSGFVKTNLLSYKDTYFYINNLNKGKQHSGNVNKGKQHSGNVNKGKQHYGFINNKKYIIGINYNKVHIVKNYIPEKFFTDVFNKNKNWEQIKPSFKNNIKNINFLYNWYRKDLYNIHSDISNLFTTSHRKHITNKSELVHTIIKHEPENYKKYMMFHIDIDIKDTTDLTKFKKLFTKDKVFILRPTWGWARRGIKVFSNFDDFNNYMKTEGIDEMNNALLSVGKSDIKEIEVVKYVLSEYLQNQLLYLNKVFNFRVFFMVTLVDNVYRSYLIKPIVMHLAQKTKSDDYSDTLQQISSTSDGEYFFDDLIKQIGRKKGRHLMRQIKHVLSFLFKIINKDRIMEIYPTMNNAFEIFGLDFIVSSDYEVKLIEFNDKVGIDDYPDIIYQSMVNGIINGTINKLYDEKYRIEVDKSNIVRIK